MRHRLLFINASFLFIEFGSIILFVFNLWLEEVFLVDDKLHFGHGVFKFVHIILLRLIMIADEHIRWELNEFIHVHFCLLIDSFGYFIWRASILWITTFKWATRRWNLFCTERVITFVLNRTSTVPSFSEIIDMLQWFRHYPLLWYPWVLSYILFNCVLHKVLGFELDYLRHEIIEQWLRIISAIFLETLPLAAPQNLSFIQADEIKTVLFEFICVVWMSKKHHWDNVLTSEVSFNSPLTNLRQSRNQKVIRKDEQLEEKLDTLFSDVKVIWVQKLDDAIEEDLWNTSDFYYPEFIISLSLYQRWVSGFLKSIAKHSSKVFIPILEHKWVCFDIWTLHFKDDIKELIEVHADFHLLCSLDLLQILVLFWRQNMVEWWIWFDKCLREIKLEALLKIFESLSNFLVHGSIHLSWNWMWNLTVVSLELFDLEVSHDSILQFLSQKLLHLCELNRNVSKTQ